jgi:hypothetical protein
VLQEFNLSTPEKFEFRIAIYPYGLASLIEHLYRMHLGDALSQAPLHVELLQMS